MDRLISSGPNPLASNAPECAMPGSLSEAEAAQLRADLARATALLSLRWVGGAGWWGLGRLAGSRVALCVWLEQAGSWQEADRKLAGSQQVAAGSWYVAAGSWQVSGR